MYTFELANHKGHPCAHTRLYINLYTLCIPVRHTIHAQQKRYTTTHVLSRASPSSIGLNSRHTSARVFLVRKSLQKPSAAPLALPKPHSPTFGLAITGLQASVSRSPSDSQVKSVSPRASDHFSSHNG